jgi:Skp family chaperone for outer membrane proteins
MERIRLIAAPLIFTIALAMAAAAQTRPGTAAPQATPRPSAAAPQTAAPNLGPVPAAKIALLDTRMFVDEKGGIIRYLNAVKLVEREFQPRQAELTGLQQRIQTIIDDLKKLQANPVVDQKSIQDKQNEGERLQLELNNKKEQADTLFAKRYDEVVGPISAEIGKALDAFAQQRGITLTLDISKLLPAILTANPAMDITTAFIDEFNSRNPATRQ